MDYFKYMDMAIEEGRRGFAEGEIPVGAVLVCGDQVVARDHNRREEQHDPTAHAEMLVIREGARRLGDWRLENCVLFVTLEPCPMCASAISQARIGLLVYGVSDGKTGAVESTINLLRHRSSYHEVQVVGGIREEACRRLMAQGFEKIRRKRQKSTGSVYE